MDFRIAFHLKIENPGSGTPRIYGSLAELGRGDPRSALQMVPTGESYAWVYNLVLPYRPKGFWYKYALKTSFGGINPEVAPSRFVTETVSSSEAFDIFGENPKFAGNNVQFCVNYWTYFGQELYVTGDCPELGNWMLDKALHLAYDVNGNWVGDITVPSSSSKTELHFRYVIIEKSKSPIMEMGDDHTLSIAPSSSPAIYQVSDCFRWHDPILDSLARSPYCDVFNGRSARESPPIFTPNSTPDTVKIKFSILCPTTKKSQRMVLVGSCKQLGFWNPASGVRMSDSLFPLWVAIVIFPKSSTPFEYKYILVDDSGTVEWESRSNRLCSPRQSPKVDRSFPVSAVINDWYPTVPTSKFKGVGIVVPLSSVRTEKSCGIGQFGDICRLVDLCNSINASMIQLLPIFDTTTSGASSDSQPYRQTSAFALHPIYIDLLNVLQQTPGSISTEVANFQAEYETRAEVDYASVYAFKMSVLRKLYAIIKSSVPSSAEFVNFVTENRNWLLPYVSFCCYRDAYGADFSNWPSHQTFEDSDFSADSLFYAWVQCIAQRQFLEAREYAVAHSVALKGDLPIGVSPLSADNWAFPTLFKKKKLDCLSPDNGCVCLGTASIDWNEMQTTNFSWWRMRLERLSRLFHSIRIDHIVNFFESFEVDSGNWIRPTFGHFVPAKSMDEAQLKKVGLWDLKRYRKPYVRAHLLPAKFGDEALYVQKTFFDEKGYSDTDKLLEFKPRYSNQNAIREFLRSESMSEVKRSIIEKGLFDFLENVSLIEENGRYFSKGDGSMNELPEPQRTILDGVCKELSQRTVDIEAARQRVDMLRRFTRMQICGDDIDVFSASVMAALADRSFLSTRIQRLSRDGRRFDDIRNLPYMCECIPSTPEMTSIRGWWESERDTVKHFWKDEIHREDNPPESCESWVQEMIVSQHLWSNAMWAMFILQDILGIENTFKRTSPMEETIHVGGKSGEWKFRYRMPIESIMGNQAFVGRMKNLVNSSGRAPTPK